MKVLVTGGGFLGANLVARLLAAGHAVRVLDVDPSRLMPRRLLGDAVADGLDWRVGDVGSFDDVAATLQGCDQVVHLAAWLTPACQADPLGGARVNALGKLHVFEAARRAGLGHVVYASSVGVYGPDDRDTPRPTTLYGTWKLAGEGVARSYWATHGISSVGLRPFIVYGAGREVGMSSGPSLACRAAVRGEPYTVPYTGASGMVYVDDVGRAFEAALRPRQRGAFVFNLCGQTVTVDEILDEIRRQVPGARLAAAGPALPIAGDVASHDAGDVLGPLPTTPLAEGIAATLAGWR